MIRDTLASVYKLGREIAARRLCVPHRPDGRPPGVVQWLLAATLRAPEHRLWITRRGDHVVARLAMRLDVRQLDQWRDW